VTDVYGEWLDGILTDPALGEAWTALDASALAHRITSEPIDTPPAPSDFVRLASLYETDGLRLYERWLADRDDRTRGASEAAFGRAFSCWRSIATLPMELWRNVAQERSGVSPIGAEQVGTDLAGELLDPQQTMAMHLATAGLLAARPSEVQLELRRFSFPESWESGDWRATVLTHVVEACCLLVRKGGGWSDIERGLGLIETLRAHQAEFETRYLSQTDPDAPEPAIELVGLYHLAQLVTLAGRYLTAGGDEAESVELRLDRHHDRAIGALETAGSGLLFNLTDLVWVTCRELVRNSIWSHVRHLGPAAMELAKVLSAQGRPNPVIELWPSQQNALHKNLLDPYPRAILVELPTSAGKTLLAKFVIAQSHTLNPDLTVAYVVPTRALVNQITRDLRPDLSAIGMSVEQAVPAMELDPTEARLLAERPDVLVTTPEKLDLLLRSGHPAADRIGLVIADEAHNLQDSERGARLELLLGTIKRDRPAARFLLLSPFLPNAKELLAWLGDERTLPPIGLDWRPSRHAVGVIERQGHDVVFVSVAAASNSLPAGYVVPLARGAAAGPTGDHTIGALTGPAVRSLVDRGSVLIYCRGKATAVERAGEIADLLGDSPAASPDRVAVEKYLDLELGRRAPLSDMLSRGIAYHHAGMSPEARVLVEGLARTNAIRVVCGTTTLAQGVNFPFTSVVFETLTKGRTRSGGASHLTYQDFWNMAGRAGRALFDPVGVVGFVAAERDQRSVFERFMRAEAAEVSSQLAGLIDRAGELATSFDLQTIERWPELSSLLQFLSHAMRVAAVSSQAADEVDDILRASLVFHQARREGPEAVRRLVEVCRSYLVQLGERTNWRGVATLTDQTGFSTPSVLRVLAETRANRDLADPEQWQADALFGADLTPLTDRVAAIAHLPEIKLGQGSNGTFSPERVAAILRDWVQGANLGDLAREHAIGNADPKKDTDRVAMDFTGYLFSQLLSRASWGLGALESVALAGRVEEPGEEAFIPSYVYFGVPRKEAVWMRMVGVPRLMATRFGQQWTANERSEPESFTEIRTWVNQMPDAAWEAMGRDIGVTVQEGRLLVAELAN
jgi:hypothetical protein